MWGWKPIIRSFLLWSFTFPAELAVLPGGKAAELTEDLGKIGTVVEAGLQSDLCYRQICSTQQTLCHLNPVVHQVLKGGFLNTVLKATQAFPGTDNGGCGDLLQGQLFSVVPVDEGQHHLDPFLTDRFWKLGMCLKLC